MKEWILRKKWRIILSGVLITAIPLLGLAFFINFQVTAALEERIVKEARWFATIAAHHLEDGLQADIRLGKQFVTRPYLLNAIQRRDKNVMLMHLKTLVDNSSSIERAFITDPQGVQIANYPLTVNTLNKDFSARDWYQGVSKDWEPYVSEFYQRAAKPRRHLFAIAVPFRMEGRVTAILVMQPKDDYVKDVLSGIDIGIGQIYVVDKKGHLIHHPQYAPDIITDFSNMPIIQKVMNGLDGVERTLDALGKKPVISAYHPVRKWGWGVVVEKPVSVVLAPVKKITAWLITFTGAMLLVGVFFAYQWAEMLIVSQKLMLDLKHYADRIEAANKDLESFSYSISHDLRSPLRAIDGFSRILMNEYAAKLDDEGNRLLTIVRENTQRMGQLIDDILAFSRAGRTKVTLSEINMEDLASAVYEELKAGVVNRDVQCEIGPLPPACGDRAMMRQVITNLLANAIKFTRPREEARITVGGYETEQENVYSVKDNGVGFDMQYGRKLFGVFERLHDMDEFEGTGIGLSIVKRIVEKHNGRVWAEGEVNKGAAFYFALPRR